MIARLEDQLVYFTDFTLKSIGVTKRGSELKKSALPWADPHADRATSLPQGALMCANYACRNASSHSLCS